MEQTTQVLENDIVAFCVKATSFPDGVFEAHQQLHKLINRVQERYYFGISYPNQQNQIIYKAAVNELYHGELKDLNLEQIVIKKGTYASIIVTDFEEKNHEIELAFKTLIKNPFIDCNGFCLEWYSLNSKDCVCLTRLTI